MDEKILAEKATEKRREYKRRWNANNRDKVKEHTRRYWERKVLNENSREVQCDKPNNCK
jgi:hypothetical protein